MGVQYGQKIYLVPARVLCMFVCWVRHIRDTSKYVRKLVVQLKPQRYSPNVMELLQVLQYSRSPNGTSLQVLFVEDVTRL
jgi:hypothetical protein